MPSRRTRAVRIVVTGHREIDRKLRGLEPKVAKKVLRQALRKNLKPVQSRAVSYAPRGETGQLRKAIKVRAAKRSRKYAARVLVVIGPGFFRGTTYYAAFPEFGTDYQRAQEYLRRAANDERSAFTERTVQDILAGIEREARGR